MRTFLIAAMLPVSLMLYCVVDYVRCVRKRNRTRPYDWERDGL